MADLPPEDQAPDPPDVWWSRRFATTFTLMQHRMVTALGKTMIGEWEEALRILQGVTEALGRLTLQFEQFINRQREEPK